ncbi:TPA: hypothetical protein ACHJ1B_005456, partial [Escherichia coli]
MKNHIKTWSGKQAVRRRLIEFYGVGIKRGDITPQTWHEVEEKPRQNIMLNMINEFRTEMCFMLVELESRGINFLCPGEAADKRSASAGVIHKQGIGVKAHHLNA